MRRAVERAERFDLAVELPAPVDEVDLSDLAYRLWRAGEEAAPSDTLIAFEVFDRTGFLRSRFSLIPEADTAGPDGDPGVGIERHRVALVRQSAVLRDGGQVWGRALVSVADWPSWDPLPPRLEVYRRLVGAPTSVLPASRPVLVFYGPDGARREEGPDLGIAIFDRVRRTGRPVRVRVRYRGEALYGELRPRVDGFQLVAIPAPDTLPRLLAAAVLLPAAAALYALGGLIVLVRAVAARRRLRDLWPPGARTFRGRLVALFVLSVMIPLLAVTFFLRASISTRSRQDTLDHARTALGTARRVLDDYLPSAAAARGRLGLLDDALLSWLANAVGFDLSVYSPEALLVASSRRDLYAAGLLPERVPGASYVAVGLAEARQRTDARLIAGSPFEELTTALSAVPGVPGVRSPVLLSLLLLPQQRVAEAEASQLTAAVTAFALLVFLVSAAIAGRLAVRVARPVADLVQGTRAVARGDFSPRLAEPPDEELRELVRAFLYMSRSLKEQTEALSREKERLATLLSQLTAGVVAYAEDGRVLLANPAAARLARGRPDGATLDEVFPGEEMRAVRAALSRMGGTPVSEELEPRPGERWRVVTVPLPLGGSGARMAVIEDVSDVVRSNRLAAWAEMARIIAHEIKNPLTPIRLSVEHLREVWRRKSSDFDAVLEECVTNVLRQTEELRRSASEFSDYARLPRPELQPTDVSGLLREAAAAYAAAPGIRWRVEADPGLVAAGRPAPALPGPREPGRQLGRRPRRRRGDPTRRAAARRSDRGLGRGRRSRRDDGDPAAALRPVFFGQERRHRPRTGHRQEDRGGTRRHDRGVEPARRGLPGHVRPAGLGDRGLMTLRHALPVVVGVAVGWGSVACHRPETRAGAASGGPPRGDAVWFTDAAALADPGIEDRLARLSAAALFLPAGELDSAAGRWSFRADPAPPAPPARIPTVLVVRAGAALAAALATEAGADPNAAAAALSAGLFTSGRPARPFGRVIGVHLDFPFSVASARPSGALLAALRRQLPPGTFVSIAASFPSPANEDARKKLAPLVDPADALVVPIFGLPGGADAAAIDALRRPWWAAFGAGVHGTLVRAGGGAPRAVPESSLDALTGDSRIDFENDLSTAEASFAAFHLTARRPVRSGGLELEAGDRVTYRVPVLSEMLYQLGSSMAGRRFALGRLLVFDGTSDAGRIFPVAAFEDVILGRSLAPSLNPTVGPAGRNAIAVEAVNPSVHASIASRTSNWVEVDLAPAHPADVVLGGFDRYVTYDHSGEAVTPGRATRVRLFETIVLPGETISPARIVLRGRAPARCCRYRSHVIAASGKEAETDWTEPPAPPTPTKAPERKRRGKPRP